MCQNVAPVVLPIDISMVVVTSLDVNSIFMYIFSCLLPVVVSIEYSLRGIC